MIKGLKEEIRALKAEKAIPTTPGPNMPAQPPLNAEVNLFKSVSLIIHKSPNKEPFKGISSKPIVQSINVSNLLLSGKLPH
ncbi:hypothetical protein CROQUDRAFT_659801 [Cronartium quercuum f. sp. fusiforme G11]|uniref:Uncharacterized protein n=1 Tax=Cronartium quercuum f. sp. fusiforme G11 TaxID=708437 RepID=A0A9P6NI46_9BASI|nr:hypothetical protein CROQUDRAFT_659801 [Cronartium quercuum f. sp. fusiforme G11]